MRYPNGQTTWYAYDRRNRLTEQTVTDAQLTVLQRYTYALDPTGRRIRLEEADGRTSDYGYDDLYRLVREHITDPAGGEHLAEYTYDAVGNRTYATVNGVGTAYSYDDNDRLRWAGNDSYGYDRNGNLTSSLKAGVWTAYSYNGKNQLTAVSGPTPAAYRYDIDGNRIAKLEVTGRTEYLVDANRDYAQVLAEQTDGQLDVAYTYGDDLLSQARDGEARYYLYDGLGSTRGLGDEAGSLTDTYDYDAFGNELGRTGATENSYRYAGEQFDANLGHYYLRARDYDPSVGRFTRMDTWRGVIRIPITLHKYVYANSDPANGIDPSGRTTTSELMTVQSAGITWGLSFSWGARAAGSSVLTSAKGRALVQLINHSAAAVSLAAMIEGRTPWIRVVMNTQERMRIVCKCRSGDGCYRKNADKQNGAVGSPEGMG